MLYSEVSRHDNLKSHQSIIVSEFSKSCNQLSMYSGWRKWSKSDYFAG